MSASHHTESDSTAVEVHVEVVYALPEHCHCRQLTLPDGASALDAVTTSGLLAVCGELDELRLGVFGERVTPDYRLANGDRVEIYRTLNLSPTEARRLRAARGKQPKRKPAKPARQN